MAYYIVGNGEELRARRERAGLSQEELAAEAGVHRNTVGNAEYGYPVQLKTARKLARVLLVEPRELARWHED